MGKSKNKIFKGGILCLAKCILLYAGCLFVGPISLADEAENSIEEVLVTAQRRSESVQDVPIAITVQTAEDLRKNNIIDIRDIGNVVPGLLYAGQSSIGVPAIRGIQSWLGSGGTEQPTAMYIDGVYQPNMWVNLMDLADIEQIDVLKGPQGTLFGRNSMGGAIVITTAKPEYETRGKISVKYGRYTGSDQDAGDKSVAAFITGPLIDDVLAYSLSLYTRDMDGYLTNDRDGSQTGMHEKTTARAKLLWEPSENTTILLSMVKSEADDYETLATQTLNDNSINAYYDDGRWSSEPWHVSTNLTGGTNPHFHESESFSLKISHYVDGWGTFTSSTSVSEYEDEFTIDLDTGTSPTCNAPFPCIDFWQGYPSEDVQQELLFTSDQFGSLSFIAGFYYYENDAGYIGNVAPVLNLNSGGHSDGKESKIGFISGSTSYIESQAIFASVDYQISDQLTLSIGGRYNDEEIYAEGLAYLGLDGVCSPNIDCSPVKHTSFDPRIALNYQYSDAMSFYVSYTEGSKGAVMSTFTLTPNDFAGPEDLSSIEVGMKATGDNYRMSAAIFTYDYEDFQDQVWNGTFAILSNVKEAEMQGIELDFLYNLSDNLQVRAVASYLDSEYGDHLTAVPNGVMSQQPMPLAIINVKGDQMRIAPELSYGLTVTHTSFLPKGELEVSASMSYSDDVWFEYLQRVKQDAWTVVNASVSYAPLTSDMRVSLFGRNLGNKKYFTSALLDPTNDSPVYSPPRQIGIALDYAF